MSSRLEWAVNLIFSTCLVLFTLASTIAFCTWALWAIGYK